MRENGFAAAIGCFSLAALAAGCSTVVESRVETGLAAAGIPSGAASCMAEIWADDLSVDQIKGIARFAEAVRKDGQTLTVVSLIDHAREWNDPQALSVVTTSAARCTFR